jgi:hypothetical protein
VQYVRAMRPHPVFRQRLRSLGWVCIRKAIRNLALWFDKIAFYYPGFRKKAVAQAIPEGQISLTPQL